MFYTTYLIQLLFSFLDDYLSFKLSKFINEETLKYLLLYFFFNIFHLQRIYLFTMILMCLRFVGVLCVFQFMDPIFRLFIYSFYHLSLLFCFRLISILCITFDKDHPQQRDYLEGYLCLLIFYYWLQVNDLH